MKKFLILSIAAATLSTAAMAETAAKHYDFARDGVRYVATETVDKGVRTISGQVVEGGSSNFTLRVKNGWVSGYVDGTRVSYPEPARKAYATRLASN